MGKASGTHGEWTKIVHLSFLFHYRHQKINSMYVPATYTIWHMHGFISTEQRKMPNFTDNAAGLNWLLIEECRKWTILNKRQINVKC